MRITLKWGTTACKEREGLTLHSIRSILSLVHFFFHDEIQPELFFKSWIPCFHIVESESIFMKSFQFMIQDFPITFNVNEGNK